MMLTTTKRFFIFLFLVVASTHAFSQDTEFETRYDSLLGFLEQENWQNAEKLCYDLKEVAEKSDSMAMEKMVLRYIYIYSVAGLLNEKMISQKEAYSKTKHLKGKEMVMPSHPFNPRCFANCTHISDQDPSTFFSGVNNADGTQVFCFEYVKIEGGIKETEAELTGKYITLRGKLDEISVEGNMLPRFKLKFINGAYRVSEE
jgi:hypothetical protein